MTVVITGAGSGVGAATARALAKQGWLVALVGRRRELLESVAASLPAPGTEDRRLPGAHVARLPAEAILP